jgi:hypothetical protein
MAHASRALALLATLLLAACPRARPEAGPVPVAMTPSQGTGLAALPVAIVGDHFDASAQTDFGKGSGALAATFQARLLPDAGGPAVPLDAVRLTADRRLEASVPAGIARGSYALEVTDPAGRVGTLAQAFRVYSAPENVTTFRVEPAEAAFGGVPFLVDLTAVDAGGAVVDGFVGQVTLSDLTGTLAPTTVGPFAGGRLQLRLTVGTLTAADRITATDALGHAGTSAAFRVDPGPAVAIAFAGGPTSVAASACSPLVTLELRDSAGNPSPAAAPVTVELQASPAGSLAFHTGGGGCTSPVTSVTISTGGATTTFRYTGPTPGAAVVRAAPAGLPSATFGVTLSP